MKITYTGRQVELAPAQLKKLEARFAKVGKLLDGRRETEAHVILSSERHLHHAEVTVHYFNHQFVGLAASADLFHAIHEAIERLEKQALKQRTKFRDNKRVPRKSELSERESVAASKAPEPPRERRVHKVNHHQKRKPMTLDEAVLEMDQSRDYLVYRDADTDKVSVLVRRRDGNFDLVEG